VDNWSDRICLSTRRET